MFRTLCSWPVIVRCAAIITGNTAASGGGIYNAPGGTVTLDKTLVVGNKGGDIVGTVKIE